MRIKKSIDPQKDVIRWVFGNKFGLIIGWAIKPGDYWYDKKLGDKPLIWPYKHDGECLKVWCLYILRAYIAVYKTVNCYIGL